MCSWHYAVLVYISFESKRSHLTRKSSCTCLLSFLHRLWQNAEEIYYSFQSKNALFYYHKDYLCEYMSNNCVEWFSHQISGSLQLLQRYHGPLITSLITLLPPWPVSLSEIIWLCLFVVMSFSDDGSMTCWKLSHNLTASLMCLCDAVCSLMFSNKPIEPGGLKFRIR